jgi:hypothetical protein
VEETIQKKTKHLERPQWAQASGAQLERGRVGEEIMWGWFTQNFTHYGGSLSFILEQQEAFGGLTG